MRYLPEFIANDDDFRNVGNVLSDEHERQRLDLQDVFSQLFIQTATWGLARWEKIIGLTPKTTDTYEDRRNRIMLWLQSSETSTVAYLESLVNRYLTGGTAHIVEHNEDSYFNIYVSTEDGTLDNIVVNRGGVHEALDIYKPAHLAYGLVLMPGRRFSLNHCGGIDKKVIPESRWQEERQHIVFPIGLNSSGVVTESSRTVKGLIKHHAYEFTHGTLNGRLRTNLSGYFAIDEKDMGGEFTENWLNFSGTRANSRASPKLNDSPTVEKSKSYHKAEWREVINRHGMALNGAGGRWRDWTEERSTTITEKGFVSPGFALNRRGKIRKETVDIGQDREITEIIYQGARLNHDGHMKKTNSKTVTSVTYYKVFTGTNLNSRKPLHSNDTPVAKKSASISRQIITEKIIPKGVVLNGRKYLANCQPESITHIVHIPLIREVVKCSGAAMTNMSKHSAYTETITHVIPEKIEKVFSPKRGTLLNNHAVMGYLRL